MSKYYDEANGALGTIDRIKEELARVASVDYFVGLNLFQRFLHRRTIISMILSLDRRKIDGLLEKVFIFLKNYANDDDTPCRMHVEISKAKNAIDDMGGLMDAIWHQTKLSNEFWDACIKQFRIFWWLTDVESTIKDIALYECERYNRELLQQKKEATATTDEEND